MKEYGDESNISFEPGKSSYISDDANGYYVIILDSLKTK